MMSLEMVLGYFEAGYVVYFGSYYGESEVESREEIVDAWEAAEDDDWLYIESVDINEEAHEVHVFVGDDE